jgi:hypothetical protein
MDACPTNGYYVIGNECIQCINDCKIVYFPVLITAVVVIVVVGVSKLIVNKTAFVTAVASLLTPLELIIWVYILYQLFSPQR